MNEIEIRNATLLDVDTKLRIIDLIAVPWEEEGDVLWRGEVWREVFDRHSFDGIEEHAGRIRVNREHVKGDTIGKLVHLDPQHELGLFTRAKIGKTQRGDDTLALAEDDMISPSIGYRVNSPADVRSNSRTKVRRVLRGFLDHLSMVEAPAFAGAKVLAVRAESSELAVVEQEPLRKTPALEEAMNDDVLMWAASRVSSRT